MLTSRVPILIVTVFLCFLILAFVNVTFAPTTSYVDAGSDQVVKVGTEVILSGTVNLSAIPLAPPYTYEWDFGDGSPPQTGAVAGEVTQVSHIYASVGAYVAMFTVSGYDQGGGMGQDSDTVTIAALNPTIETYDAATPANQKDVFDYLEAIQLNGSGYLPSFNPPTYRYWIWIESDRTWVDNMTLPGDWGQTGPVSTSSGNLETVLIPYHWYLPPGKYDIVVDVDDDGVYDEGLDALDDLDINGAGFHVVPEYPLGTILGVVGCFAALGVFFIAKRKNS